MRTIARSAATGRFVTKEEAAADPAGTVVETMTDGDARARVDAIMLEVRSLLTEAAELMEG